MMYNKEKAETVLKKGTEKEKILLLANHYAETIMSGNGFLTDEQISFIRDMATGGKNARFLEKMRKAEVHIRNFIQYLQPCFLDLQLKLQALNHHLTLMKTYTQTEMAINEMLKAANGKSKTALLTAALNNTTFDYCKTKKATGGQVSFDIGGKKGLLSLINEDLQKFELELSCFKTSIDAVKRYIRRTGADISCYKEKIKSMELWTKRNCGPKGMTVGLWPEHLQKKGWVVKGWHDVSFDQEHKTAVEKVLK